MGIIDALSSGFRLVFRHWWLMLIPILLDLFLWMGPRVSILQVVQDSSDVFRPSAEMELGQDYQEMLEQTQRLMDQLAQNFNMLTLLSAGVPGIPSLVATTDPQVSILSTDRQAIEMGGVSQSVGWGIGLLIAGAFLASAYVSLIGRTILLQDRTLDEPFTSHTVHTWVHVMLFVLAMFVLALAVGVPMLLFAGFLMLISQPVGLIMLNLMTILLIWLGIWAAIYLFFVVDSIVIHRVSFSRSMWNSVNVVMRNFWATLGLIILVNVIGGGMMLIWQRLAFAVWGVLVGIFANAFVGSGLTAASVMFYISRYTRWQEQQDAISKSLFGRYFDERQDEQISVEQDREE